MSQLRTMHGFQGSVKELRAENHELSFAPSRMIYRSLEALEIPGKMRYGLHFRSNYFCCEINGLDGHVKEGNGHNGGCNRIDQSRNDKYGTKRW